MAQKRANPADDCGALDCRAGRHGPDYNHPRDEKQFAPDASECIRELRRARLERRLPRDKWTASFVRKIFRRCRQRHWVPSAAQIAKMRSLIVEAAEDADSLIDEGDDGGDDDRETVTAVTVMPYAVANRTSKSVLDAPTAGLRFERQIEHLHRLGPRPLAELLAEIAHHTGESRFIADRVEAYSGLDADFIRAVGGNRFPAMPLGVVK